ncbi:uncharacterized protein LOC103572909 [Microplitis demolitor]|uniref:uncharacterized protein LOC103572909 n=1 Tax=Microplitis demolitor TaxID=69319 RepID=UPI0004CDAD74|nr:uncharacterized protein LOC103572909 [Microplitis demolitor]
MRNFDKVAFQTNIKNKLNKLAFKHGGNNICDKESFNVLVDKIICDITDSLNIVAPIVTKISKLEWKSKPWISKNIVNKIKIRDNAFFKAKVSKIESDIVLYKKLRNDVVNELRLTKKLHYQQHIDDNKSKPDELWKSLKELIGDKRKNDSMLSNEVNFDGNIVSDANTVANRLNKYFIDNVRRIVMDINCNKIMENNRNYNNSNHFVLWEKFQEVTVAQVDMIIKNLDIKKGSNMDINVFIVKLLWEIEKDSILFMLNNSLKHGIVPDQWKTSTIIPIQKILGSTKAEDLRPINTLPIFEQILEQTVKNQLDRFIQENNILNEEQSGFREKFSCETALQSSFIDWRNYIDAGMLVGVTYIDLTKAFETINRNQLLELLKELGVSGTKMAYRKVQN